MPTPAPSFQYDARSNDLLSPVWTLRVAPICILTSLLLAILVYVVVKTWPVVQAGAGQSLLGTPFNVALPVSGLEAGAVVAAIFVLIRLLLRKSDAAR